MKTRLFNLGRFGRLIVVTLTCLSMLSQAVHASVVNPTAQAFNLQTWNQTAEALRPRYSVSVRPAAAKIDQKAVDAKNKSTNIGQAGRVLILILALNGVELVRKQAREARLSGRTLTNEEYAKLAAEAAVRVTDSGDIWLGIASDLGIGAVSKKPVAALNEVLKNKVAKPIFVNLIQTGIMSLIYFVGFQACAQLWRDARLMLDPKDYEKSERIWSTGFKAVMDTASAKTDSDESRITRQMIGNMAKILFVDDELRENWFYNTWRLAIATGRFVSLVSGIIAATTIGTAIFPGAGTVLGFIFALTGALAAAALPASVTEKITLKLKDSRIAVTKLRARQYNWRLTNLVNAYTSGNIFWRFQSDSDEVSHSLKVLKRLRERVTTGYIEEIYIANTNIQKYTHELAVTLSNRRGKQYVEVANHLQSEITKRKSRLRQMVSFYGLQLANLQNIRMTAKTPDSVVNEIERAKQEVAVVQSFLKTFAEALIHSESYPSSEQILQNYYLRSFREAGITRLAKQQNNLQSVKQL